MSSPFNDYDLDVHHIRPRRAGHEMGLFPCQGIELLKKRVRIVVVQELLRPQTVLPRLHRRRAVHNASCCIGRAVRPIRTGREQCDALYSLDLQCKSECQLLVPAARSRSPDCDRCLSARKEAAGSITGSQGLPDSERF